MMKMTANCDILIISKWAIKSAFVRFLVRCVPTDIVRYAMSAFMKSSESRSNNVMTARNVDARLPKSNEQIYI